MALLQTLIDSKKEYTNHLCDLITPFLVNVFFDIYNGLKSGSAAQRNILQRFQAEISKIAEWNTEQIRAVYTKFTAKTKCTYLGSLVKELVLTNVKIHLKNHDIPLSDFKVQIRVPGGESFYHRVLVNAARAIWKQPFIFYHQVRTVEHQNNIIAIEKLVRDTIISTLRACIPMEEMMRITSMAQSSAHSESDATSSASSSDDDDESSSASDSDDDTSSNASDSSGSDDDASSSSASNASESDDDTSSSASDASESDDDASSSASDSDDDTSSNTSGSNDDASSASSSSDGSDNDASSASGSDDDAATNENGESNAPEVPEIRHEVQDALEPHPEALEAPEAPESPEKKVIDYEPLSRLSQKKRPVADGTFF